MSSLTAGGSFSLNHVSVKAIKSKFSVAMRSWSTAVLLTAVPYSDNLQVWRLYNIRCWTNGRPLHYWRGDLVWIGLGTIKFGCVWPVWKEIGDPVIDIVWHAQAGKLRHKSAWRNESNALLKSKAITRTQDCVSKVLVINCNRLIKAAVVEPVGLKANWSWNVRWDGGFRIAG